MSLNNDGGEPSLLSSSSPSPPPPPPLLLDGPPQQPPPQSPQQLDQAAIADIVNDLSPRKSFIGRRSSRYNKDPASSTEPAPPNPSNLRRIYVNIPPVAPFVEVSSGKPLGSTTYYAPNKVSTGKYSIWSFLPKNLYEQFRSVANFYFLSLVILQAFQPFAIASVGLTAAPIVIIVVVTGVKDAIEDWRRHESDKTVNKSTTYLLTNWKNMNYDQQDLISEATAVSCHSLSKTFWRRVIRPIFSTLLYLIQLLFMGGKYNKTAPSALLAGNGGGKNNPEYMTTEDYLQFPIPDPTSPPPLPDILASTDPNAAAATNTTDAVMNITTTSSFTKDQNHPQILQSALASFPNTPDNNLSTAQLIKNNKGPIWKRSKWEDVRVGDFVLIRNNDNIPADIIIISSSEEDSIVYVETKNLDGETNLKVKRGIQDFALLCSPEECVEMMAYFDTELPNAHMYSFNGTAVFKPPRSQNQEIKTIPLTINSVLLRGCTLRNTQWVIGIAASTGKDSKLMKNAGVTPSKRSTIAKKMNPQVIVNFVILAAMCFICAVMACFYESSFDYIQPLFAWPNDSITSSWYTGITTFLFSLINFQNIIPIAIYISIDFAETFQSYMINQDLDMYDEESEKSAIPNTWNLCDELGQVEYIFSDKTGTLTCNVMAFRKCSINGIMYGDSVPITTSGQESTALSSSTNTSASLIRKENHSSSNRPLQHDSKQKAYDEAEKRMRELMASSFDTKYITKEKLSFVDHRMHRHLAEGIAQANISGLPSSRTNMSGRPGQAASIIEFFTLLAVCHTVLVDTGDSNHIKYKSQSPDEEALVDAAKNNGFTFLRRIDNQLEVDIMGQTKRFTILNALEFNSDRKRMSVIVRKEDEGNVVLLCKGADSVIAQRLRPDTDQKLFETTFSHLEAFARDGLRTLCLAYKIIPKEVYEPWAKRYSEAQNLITDREAQVDAIANLIESDLTLMGATAIEDKLQQGVPECIATLGRAGIKIWVLTGDKLETAVNVGFSCNLLEQKQIMIIIASTTSEESTRAQIVDALNMFWCPKGTPLKGDSYALIIDGDSLKYALMPGCKDLLLELACRCKSVICCRVSPKQKAKVVSLVRKGLGAICLAIGDGANDVNMIKVAHVGVGISGKEGMQAVMASDYAIAQFRFLSKLLLVHGRWAYVRISEMVLCYFYKNIVFLFILFWFQFDCGFSGSLVMEYTYGVFFNTVFTLWPNMLVGMLDQDICAEISMQVPQLHQKGMRQILYNMDRFWTYLAEGLFQSLVCYYIGYCTFVQGSVDPRGLDPGINMMGNYIAFYSIITVNICLNFNIQSWTWMIHAGFWLDLLCFVAYVVAFSLGNTDSTYGTVPMMLTEPTFYLSIMLSVTICMIPRITFNYMFTQFRPSDTDIIQELKSYLWKSGRPISRSYTGQKHPESSKHSSDVASLTSSHDDHSKQMSMDSSSSSLRKNVNLLHVNTASDSNTNIGGNTSQQRQQSYEDSNNKEHLLVRKTRSESYLINDTGDVVAAAAAVAVGPSSPPLQETSIKVTKSSTSNHEASTLPVVGVENNSPGRGVVAEGMSTSGSYKLASKIKEALKLSIDNISPQSAATSSTTPNKIINPNRNSEPVSSNDDLKRKINLRASWKTRSLTDQFRSPFRLSLHGNPDVSNKRISGSDGHNKEASDKRSSEHQLTPAALVFSDEPFRFSVTEEEASHNAINDAAIGVGTGGGGGGGGGQQDAATAAQLQLSTSSSNATQNVLLSSPPSSPNPPESSKRREKHGETSSGSSSGAAGVASSLSSKSSSSRRFHEIFFARKSKGIKPNFLDTHLAKADSRQMIFMKAPDKEVSNTGFSFSHEGGMGDVICSPSRTSLVERTTDGSPCEMTAGGSIRMNDFAMKRQASLKRRKESAARELSMSSAAAVGSKESPTITGSGGGGSANAAGSATVTAASAANLGRYLRGPHNKRGSGRSKSEHGRELSGRELDEQAFEMFQLSQTNLAVVHERGFSGASVYSIDQASPGGGVVVVKKHGKDGSGSGSGSNNHSKEVSKDSSKQRLEGEELVPPVPPIPSKIGAGGATHRRDRGSEEEASSDYQNNEQLGIQLLQDACAELAWPEEAASSSTTTSTVSPLVTPIVDEETPPGSSASVLKSSILPDQTIIKNNINTTTTNNHDTIARSATAAGGGGGGDYFDHLVEPIETSQQFFKWFSDIEKEMEKGQEDIYRAYLASIVHYRDACSDVLTVVGGTSELLDNLMEKYRFVENKSKALQNACEELLSEQTHLTNIAEELTLKLDYFNALDPVTKLLGSGDAVCMDDKFIPTLVKLDDCLAFLAEHRDYKDADYYILRYRHCLTRSLTFVKSYFITSMRALQTEIKGKLADRPKGEIMDSSLHSSLFYVKFKTQALHLKPLIAEIEYRYEGFREYYGLFVECLAAYFQCRKVILADDVATHIGELTNEGELFHFLQKGCDYMISVCREELSLFHNFFNSGEDEFSGYLDELSYPLYVTVRPIILQETRIDLLADVCLQLQEHITSSNLTTQQSESSRPNSPIPLQLSEPLSARSFDSLDNLEIPSKVVVRRILEDAQQRLVFRAQVYLRDDIQMFKMRDEEIISLFYRGTELPRPNPMKTTVSMSPVLDDVSDDIKKDEAKEQDSLVNGADHDSISAGSGKRKNSVAERITKAVYGGGEWFPTLQRTLLILGKLYKCIPRSIFEDISQEAVDICRRSLLDACEVISTKQVTIRNVLIKPTKLDGQLFLIKNLLMLREQISHFEASFIRKEDLLDLSTFQDFFSSLTQNTWTLASLGKNIIAAATPKVVHSFVDSKLAVDKELKRVCEELILETSKKCAGAVQQFLLMESAFRLRNDQRPVHMKELLPSQNFAQPDKILKVSADFQETLDSNFGGLVEKMSYYLGDRKTESILLKVIKTHIIEAYQSFVDIVHRNYDAAVSLKLMSVQIVSTKMEKING